MATAVLESPNMAKRKPEADKGTESRLVRYTARMEPEVRARLKAYCALVGEDMEDVGARWITERLAIEERKLRS
jgi:LPS O-antigen subunit length determinant protein (WzzB/FepE family)